MSNLSDVTIVGGGVIGLTTAWYLAGSGASVTLVEAGQVGRQASWAGAGILPPASLKHARTPLDRLRAYSLSLYATLTAELRETTGLDNGYCVCGGIELPDPGHPDLLPPTEEWHSEGVDFDRLHVRDLRAYFADISETIEEAVYLPDLAQVRNPWHLRALQAGCAARGVRFLTDWPVEGFQTEADRVVALKSRGDQLPVGELLVTTGAWSASLLAQLNWTIPVRPIRGQMVLFHTHQPIARPILLQGKRYLVPRGDGRILVGSTEEDVGFDVRTTDKGISGLIDFARTLLPSLSNAKIEATWAGLRPGTTEALPFLGRLPNWANVHVATGHFRAGLLLSPATGKLMAQTILGNTPAFSIHAFRLDRDGIPTASESR